MVKGTTKQVVVVKIRDSSLFDEAIFLMRDVDGVTTHRILEEAQRLASYPIHGKRHRRWLKPLLWSLCGAACTGLGWLLTALA